MSTDERQPITRQRSDWREIALEPTAIAFLSAGGSTGAHAYVRRVGDGWLRAIRSTDNGLLHLSISWMPQVERQARRGALRYPTWDEIAHARDELLPDDVEFVMYLPRAGEYVAVHATTFHLREHRAPAP